MKKEEFKIFVKKNPSLVKYIKSKEKTWQDFYEIYDMYGEDDNVWNTYLNKNSNVKTKIENKAFSFGEVVSWLKNVDLDGLQEGIGNVQRVLGVVQDFNKNDTNITKKEYKPRPLYKHFED